MLQASAQSKTKHRQLPALTLLEIILTVSILSMVTAVVLPLSQNMLYQDELNTTLTLCAKAVYTAEQNARNGNSDEQWGVHWERGKIIVFKGASYALRDVNADLVTNVSTRINFSGNTEVLFDKLTGLPLSAATINVSENNTTKPVSISSKGRLVY